MVIEHLPSEAFVGYTEVSWSPERAPVVYQGSTAVRPDFRGQDLGKWLKAAIVHHVQTHFTGAQFIRTANADVNDAMLGINRALGFKPFMTRITWEVSVDTALGHLA